ncbi:hypothetical protein LQZ18_04185 [Lachnospiraceae bacterium ZAX-1]
MDLESKEDLTAAEIDEFHPVLLDVEMETGTGKAYCYIRQCSSFITCMVCHKRSISVFFCKK